MIADNLNNICSSGSGNVCKDTSDKRLDALEQVNTENAVHFESQNITAQKLSANDAKLTKVVAGNITTDSINGGAGILDSLKVNGNIVAKNFSIEEPVIVSEITAGNGNIATLKSTALNADNATIKNLTVENLSTPTDASLEYKNITVTNNASINTLNLTNPYIAAVETDSLKTPNLTTQEVVQKDNGSIKRVSSTDPSKTQNVISYGDKTVIVGDKENSVNLAGIDRPKWNDRALATLSDIETGSVVPVMKGVVETFDQLPIVGNTRGDLYIVKQLTIGEVTGIGHAQWNGSAWDPYLIYELHYYPTSDQVNKLVSSLQQQIGKNISDIAKNRSDLDYEIGLSASRDTQIIEGATPVKVAAAGLKDTEGRDFAVVPFTMMLLGSIQVDVIPENTALNTFLQMGQYTVTSETLAATITDIPEGETGPFSLIVGMENVQTTLFYQVYINTTDKKIFFRLSNNGTLEAWRRLPDNTDLATLSQAIEDEMTDAINRETAIIDGVTPVKKAATGLVNSDNILFATVNDVSSSVETEKTAREAADKAIRTELGNGTLKAKEATHAVNADKATSATNAGTADKATTSTRTNGVIDFGDTSSSPQVWGVDYSGNAGTTPRAWWCAFDDKAKNIVPVRAPGGADPFPVNSVITIEAVTEAEARQSLPPYGTWYGGR